jgi:hypothetical protein
VHEKLYSLKKHKPLEKDKSKEDLEFEQQKDQCTFSPNTFAAPY